MEMDEGDTAGRGCRWKYKFKIFRGDLGHKKGAIGR